MTEFEKATTQVKQMAVDQFKKKLIESIRDVYEHEYEYSTVSGECDEFYQDVINLIKNT